MNYAGLVSEFMYLFPSFCLHEVKQFTPAELKYMIGIAEKWRR